MDSVLPKKFSSPTLNIMSWVLLVEIFNEKPKGISTLETRVSSKYKNFYFGLDNFSDDLSSNYAKKLLDECDKILIVFWEHEQGDWSRIQPLLNGVLGNRKKVRIISNTKQPRLERIAKIVTLEDIPTEELLLHELKIS